MPEDVVPLYEYECKKCGHEFEALVIGTRKPACPKCKSEDLQKRVSSVAFAGVGGGWGRSSSRCGTSGGGGG
jgi:putative FmdB family regulatory protein